MTIKRIPIASISMAQTQTRATICMDTVAEYAARMQEGDEFPSVTVCAERLDTGESVYFLSQGFHRVLAAKESGFVEIDAEISDGSVADAILAGAGSNEVNGLRRTNKDKRREVEMVIQALALKGEKWSNRIIAEKCRVSVDLVGGLRKDSTVDSDSSNPPDESNNKTVGADGKARDTSNIGKTPPRKCPVCDRRMSKKDENEVCAKCREKRQDEGATGIPEREPSERGDTEQDEGEKPKRTKFDVDAHIARGRVMIFQWIKEAPKTAHKKMKDTLHYWADMTSI